jgi:heat shock protein HtpX
MSSERVDAPLLIHDRIDANRRTIRLLQVMFPLVILPTFLHATSYLTLIFTMSAAASSVAGANGPPRLHLLASSLAAIALVVGVTILVHRHSAALVLRLTGARPLEGNARDEAALAQIVENLCIGSGLPRPRLALIESTAANAYSTGMDPEEATLVVTRGLLTLLDRQELEGVVAQELSQIGNEDVRLGTLMAAVVTVTWLPFLLLRRLFRRLQRQSPKLAMGCLVVFLIWIVLPMLASILIGLEMSFEMLGSEAAGSGEMPRHDPRAAIALISVMLLALYNLVAAPVIGLLIRRAVSREREFLADANAALLTRYPPGLARALTKLGAGGNASLEADPSVAHVWIMDPRPDSPLAWLRIWSVHPALDERIQRLSRMGGTTPSMLEKAAADGARYSDSLGESTRSGGASPTLVQTWQEGARPIRRDPARSN